MSRKPKKIDTVSKRYKESEPLRKSTARALLYLNAIFWFVYAIYIFYDMAVINNNGVAADIVTVFSLVNVASLFTCGALLGREEKWVYYLAIAVVILNTILTFVNLVELFFMAAFIINLFILWMLYKLRSGYLSKP